MQISRNQIVEFLRERGDADEAAQAEQDLPEHLDSEDDAEQLERLGVDPRQLVMGNTFGM